MTTKYTKYEQKHAKKLTKQDVENTKETSSNSSDLRNRCWCLTLNNYTEEDYKHIWNLEYANGESYYKYIVLGREVGEKGTKHIQGYMEFKNARTFNGLLKLLPHGVHIELRQGTSEQASAYCKKEEQWEEKGKISHQGERTDFAAMIEDVKNNTLTDVELIDKYGQIAFRSDRQITRLRLLTAPKRIWKMHNRIYYGGPGTGKTRSVYEEFGFDRVYVKSKNKWWDGYQGQEVVIMDDFDPKEHIWSFAFLLVLLDRYPLTVEIKTGTVNFCSKVIIFTTNINPETWFTDRPNRSAFFRRIDYMVPFGEGQEIEVKLRQKKLGNLPKNYKLEDINNSEEYTLDPEKDRSRKAGEPEAQKCKECDEKTWHPSEEEIREMKEKKEQALKILKEAKAKYPFMKTGLEFEK